MGAALDADTGWASALNQPATVQADQPFRIRFELERAAQPPGEPAIVLQYRRNEEEDWIEAGAHDFPYPEAEEPRAPRLSVVSTPAYSHGAPAKDLLNGSGLPYGGGVGINLASQAPSWFPGNGHHELEWPLVIRRFADGPVVNETGDRFEIRLADGRGTTLPGHRTARVVLSVPPGHVGGTFVETPGRIGPWQAQNGDLYFIMEPAESDNVFMMIKSRDGGKTWLEVDGSNRPRTGDLESVDGRMINGSIHIAHQVTESVRYHEFRTSDHPTSPDTWGIRDEVVTEVESIAQATSLVVRADGSMVAFFVGSTLGHAIRDAGGRWSEGSLVDPDERRILAGPQAVVGENDDVHVAYYREDGTLWHRVLGKEGSLTTAVQVAEGLATGKTTYGSILPLVFLPESKQVAILYRSGDGHLWERRVDSNGQLTQARRVTDREVVNHAVDSQQPAADVIGVGNTLYVIFADAATGHLYGSHDQGGWQPPALLAKDIEGSWIRGNLLKRADGALAYGFVYDAGSKGGGGMNRFAEMQVK